jgi:DNA-binding NtrC family response regulator
VRLPAPSAMLIEHPAVPMPTVDGRARESVAPGDEVAVESLSRSDRYQVAVQLTAAASLLAEFDLWPGRRAFREVRVNRARGGLQATLGRFPLPLSPVYRRLGGGEAAAETSRSAVLAAISDTVALPVAEIDVERDEPGFFLERAVMRQLRELSRPLAPATARALWALRWDLLPLPDAGATSYWRVPSPETANRLAASLWSSLLRRGQPALLRPAGAENVPPDPDEGSVLITAGTVTDSDLAEMTRWTLRDSCSAVVIGTFPRGWHPPHPPVFDARYLARHLAVVGVPLAEAREIVDRRQGRFSPFDEGEREALTKSARSLFPASSTAVRERPSEAQNERILQLLSLEPDGLSMDFLMRHSGLANDEMKEGLERVAAVAVDAGWRLPEPTVLGPDPLHSDIAALLTREDPRRLLHEALGTGDSVRLAAWARERLDRLEGFAVRDLLAHLAPGACGTDIQLLATEACLSVLDLSGARSSLADLPPELGRIYEQWLDAIDRPHGREWTVPCVEDVRRSPRAVAEVVIFLLWHHRSSRGELYEEGRGVLEQVLPRLGEPLMRRMEIELAAIEQPELLVDSGWRREMVVENPRLQAQMIHRVALHYLKTMKPRPARRLLKILANDRFGPGFRGAIEFDLGAVALTEGRSHDAHTHQLRAFRVFQAAGFRYRTHKVLFNLAVADLDQLRVLRARDRLDHLAAIDREDPFVLAERIRLELAVGNEETFREFLAAFESAATSDDPRFTEGLNLLRGASAALDGDFGRASDLFAHSGQEGEAWSALVDAVSCGGDGGIGNDGWGVSLAARLVSTLRGRGDVAHILGTDSPTSAHALAIALAERVGGQRLQIARRLRSEAARRLRAEGLEGWAEQLSGRQAPILAAVEVLAGIMDSGGPENIDPDHIEELLAALEVEGLELRDAADGRLIWNIGRGLPGTEVRRGRVSITPLGGEVSQSPLWSLLIRILELQVPPGAPTPDSEIETTGFYGKSAAAREVRRQLCELGPAHLAVLLLGETGVGKEVAATALHRLSGRSGSLIAVNVAAIPTGLLEAELFGSVKGAFTGADRSRRGLVVAADGGTLFLDEIGDLDPPLQVKLLRFLESQEVRPVGSTEEKTVDVRIVAATHRDLERRMREGMFRPDLYYRVAGLPVTIPPLRERREDVGILTRLFEAEALARYGLESRRWSSEARETLRRYDWPGNVRELRQTVEVALVRARGGVVLAEHLPIVVDDDLAAGTWREAQREFRRRFLTQALRRNHGNRSATARELGISRQALLYHLRNLGLTDTERG